MFGSGVRDHLAGRGGTGEGDLCNTVAVGQGGAHVLAEAVDNVQRSGREQVTDQFHQHQHGSRRAFGRLHDHAVTGDQCGGQLPRTHEQREVPRNDLGHDAQRLMEMVGDGGGVDLAQCAFLGADAASEVTEMINGQRNIGGHGFTDGLAIVPCLGPGEQVEVLFHDIGCLEQDQRAVSGGHFTPCGLGLVRGIKRQFHIGCGGSGDFTQHAAINGGSVGQVMTINGSNPLATDIVAITGLERGGC